MKKNIIIVIVIIVVLGGWSMFQKIKNAPVRANGNESLPASNGIQKEIDIVRTSDSLDESTSNGTGVNKTEDKVINTTKEFTVTGTNYKFEPNMMSVNVGDTVKITFKDINGFHDFVIDELNVATKKLNTGNEQTVTFVANKSGSFQYYCSVGSHRSMGMQGVLVVK